MTKDRYSVHPAISSFIARAVFFTTAALIMFFGFPSILNAETASPEEMDNVCRNWVTYTVYQTGDWAGDSDPGIIDVQDIIENDTLLARYYTLSSGGSIIIPALKNLPPVKVYSEESTLDIYEADGFALMIRQVLQHRIRLFVEVYGSLEAIPPSDEQPLFGTVSRERWDDFSVSPREFSVSANKNLREPSETVGPLLTTTWHQNYPYNLYCPIGDGGRCLAGCVATALAQIMWYHQWPPAGDGSHSYYWSGDNSCGGSSPGQTLSADFSDPYIYQSTTENLAEINYEVGVAINMDYGYCGSGAYFYPIPGVMINHFKYDESITEYNRTSFTPESWFALVQTQINQGLPTLYGIYSHAIVCDGWRIQGSLNQYHMNYGWGGGYNAWYTVDDLHCPWPGCGIGAESMIFNIIPKSGSPWLGANDLSDAAFGDGDGIPEAGETIELTFTIANYGGAEVTDVSINMSVDDAEINVIDGYVNLGTIPARDSTDNAGDPLVFEIPIDYIPRIDSFLLEITWNGGSEIDTLVTEKNIGRTQVLLVDDDNEGGVETYYKDALEDFRIPYHTWIHSAHTSPDSAYLVDYDVVIWFAGDYQASPLNLNEITALKGYMNAGGSLFMTGQGIAAQLDSYNPAFLNNYLRSDYQLTFNVPVLATVPGGQVFDTGHIIAIQGGNGASNQDYPDQVLPINGGVTELQYLGQENSGGISYAGDYKLVFFSFGYEAVVSEDTRFRGRDSVMSDIMNFFGYQRPGSCPEVKDLAVSPGATMNLVDHTPDFSWTYIDAEGSPQTMYHFQVGSDADWELTEMWDYGPISGADNNVTYQGLELIDGGNYYVRVRSCDGTLWSGWTNMEIRMNSIPAAVTDPDPAGMQGVTTAYPELSHTNAFDAEGDALTHYYQVYGDEAMTILITESGEEPASYGTNSWTVDVSLTEDEDYYWRVRGSDPYESGEWSSLASFWVNADNQLPEAFDLVLPPDGSTLPDLEPTFAWTASGDSDPYDIVRYTLYYSTDPTFATSTTIGDIEITEYAVESPLDYGEDYFWKVKAYDMFGGETMSTQTFGFSTAAMGDANGDGNVDVGDAVFIINYVFKGGAAPDPIESGDANCDQDCNVGDAVFIINYVFKGGPEPGC